MEGSRRAIVVMELESWDGERRRLTYEVRPDSSLRMVEETEGPLTEVLFGASSCRHEVCVAREQLAALGWALGAADACDTTGQVVPYLRCFFTGGTPFLSDLMDLLDATQVTYSYASYAGTGDLCFRPSQAGMPA